MVQNDKEVTPGHHSVPHDDREGARGTSRSQDQPRILRRAVRNMEAEDLEDFTMVHPGGGQPPRQQLGECEQREGQCGERDRVRGFSLLTWKSPSPTSTTRKRATPKVGAKVKTEEILDKTVDEVCGIEMVVGPRPMCHCQLPTQIHVGHTPKNPDRMPFRGTKEGNVPQAEYMRWENRQG